MEMQGIRRAKHYLDEMTFTVDEETDQKMDLDLMVESLVKEGWTGVLLDITKDSPVPGAHVVAFSYPGSVGGVIKPRDRGIPEAAAEFVASRTYDLIKSSSFAGYCYGLAFKE